MTLEQKKVRELARIEASFRGADLRFEDVARHVPACWGARFIAEQCELAGFPVWASAPESAFKPW